jgi:serine/threonine protein kinase
MSIEVKVGSELRDRYVISHPLGDGGYGIVWRATDKKEGRDVAIKRMKNLGGGEIESLMAEAKKISALKGHRNIVEMYETFVEEREGFLVMEYVEGKNSSRPTQEQRLG